MPFIKKKQKERSEHLKILYVYLQFYMFKTLLVKINLEWGTNRPNVELAMMVKWVLVPYARMKSRLLCLATQRKVVSERWSFTLLCSAPEINSIAFTELLPYKKSSDVF